MLTQEIIKLYNGATPIGTPRFSQWARNVHSQCGEDGILEEIFNRIGEGNKQYLEFGAWDGAYFSNSAYLRSKGWAGTLWEGDEQKVNSVDNRKDINLNFEFVYPENINELLKKYEIPKNLDFLSIDIDSDDSFVWEAINEEICNPRVLIIEYNTGLPNCVPLRAEKGKSRMPINNPGAYFNCNLNKMLDIAESKDYELVDVVSQNVIFIEKSEFEKLGIPKITKQDALNIWGRVDVSDFWFKRLQETNDLWLTE